MKERNPLAELNQCVLNPAYGFVVNILIVLWHKYTNIFDRLVLAHLTFININ